jgi:hypothetical protein
MKDIQVPAISTCVSVFFPVRLVIPDPCSQMTSTKEGRIHTLPTILLTHLQEVLQSESYNITVSSRIRDVFT